MITNSSTLDEIINMCYKNKQNHIKLGYSSISTLYACENNLFLKSLKQIQIITYWFEHLKENHQSQLSQARMFSSWEGLQVSKSMTSQVTCEKEREQLWVLMDSQHLFRSWTFVKTWYPTLHLCKLYMWYLQKNSPIAKIRGNSQYDRMLKSEKLSLSKTFL